VASLQVGRTPRERFSVTRIATTNCRTTTPFSLSTLSAIPLHYIHPPHRAISLLFAARVPICGALFDAAINAFYPNVTHFPALFPSRSRRGESSLASPPCANIFALNEDIVVSPLFQVPGLSLQPVDRLGLLPLHRDDPIHPDDVPPVDMPAPFLCTFPADHLLLPSPPWCLSPASQPGPYGLVHTEVNI
jgi:hypothetical protein